MELTNTNVRYLLTIYHLSQARLEVSSKDIAQTLDVSRASVTSMMSILTDKRLVTKERYGKVHLTDDAAGGPGCWPARRTNWPRRCKTGWSCPMRRRGRPPARQSPSCPATVLSPSMFQTDRERKFSNHEVVSESEVLCFAGGVAAPWWEPRLPSPPRPVSSAWPAWPRA